jgi:hypothetical protein
LHYGVIVVIFLVVLSPAFFLLIRDIKKGVDKNLLGKFAELNKLTFEPKVNSGTNDGFIKEQRMGGLSSVLSSEATREIINMIRIPCQPTQINLFNIEVTATFEDPKTGIVRTEKIILNPHFAQFTLESQMPFLRLAPKKGVLRKALALSGYRGSTEINLEGEINKYFDILYTPGMQNETLRILDPEMMQFLIDNARGLNIEFRQNHLYVYKDTIKSSQDLKQVLGAGTAIAAGLYKRMSLISDDALLAGKSTKKPYHSLSNLGIAVVFILAVLWVVATISEAL